MHSSTQDCYLHTRQGIQLSVRSKKHNNIDYSGVQVTEKTCIIKKYVDMKQHLSKPIQGAKIIIKKNMAMVFHNEKEYPRAHLMA